MQKQPNVQCKQIDKYNVIELSVHRAVE